MTPPPSPAGGSSRRRLWPLLILVAAVIGVLLFSRHRPVDVEADYVLLSARKDLAALHVRWEGLDDGKVVTSSYHYDGATPAPRIQSQTLTLPPNTYRVRMTLDRRDGTSEVVEQEVVIEQASSIELHAQPSR